MRYKHHFTLRNTHLTIYTNFANRSFRSMVPSILSYYGVLCGVFLTLILVPPMTVSYHIYFSPVPISIVTSLFWERSSIWVSYTRIYESSSNYTYYRHVYIQSQPILPQLLIHPKCYLLYPVPTPGGVNGPSMTYDSRIVLHKTQDNGILQTTQESTTRKEVLQYT